MENALSPRIYQQVADRITEQIRSGVLPPGSRDPSLRLLSRQMGDNMATLNRAYWMLENRGILESRPSSGFYVRPEAAAPSAPSGSKGDFPLQLTSPKKLTSNLETFKYMFSALANPSNLFVSLGIPGLAVLKSQSLQKSLRSSYARPGLKALDYNWFLGYEPLRRQLARHYLDCGL